MEQLIELKYYNPQLNIWPGGLEERLPVGAPEQFMPEVHKGRLAYRRKVSVLSRL